MQCVAVPFKFETAISIKVPRDGRVAGFDDAKIGDAGFAGLTTIHQPCRGIAVIAFRTMLERIAEPTLPAKSIALTPLLVVRGSCGAYLPRSAVWRPEHP
jgi:DNA-binding LacI/PurR family transcriptional regulator